MNRLVKYYILFILLSSTRIFAAYELGIGTGFSYMGIKELGSNASSSSFYFQEKKELPLFHIGLSLHLNRLIPVSKSIILLIGPYLELGQNILSEETPARLKATGNLYAGFGLTMMIRYMGFKAIQPHFSLCAGSQWSWIQWNADFSDISGDIVSYNEEFFGPVFKISLGGIFKIIKVDVFFDAGYSVGFYSVKVSDNDGIIPSGNSLIFGEFFLKLGILLRFKT